LLQTNAKLAEYINYPAWDLKSTEGATIKSALDYAIQPQFSPIPGQEFASELFPQVASVAAVYGDPEGKYAAYLLGQDSSYINRNWYFWDQPLGDSGLTPSIGTGAATPEGGSGSGSGSGSGGGANGNANANGVAGRWGSGAVGFVVLGLLFSVLGA